MIYLDNAATTKPDEECLKLAEKYLYEEFYNPSALYREGYGIQLEVRQARENILALIADKENFELIFTSCGTEADNAAIFGAGRKGNVVTTMGEHSAVFSAVNELKQRGIEVRFASLNADGNVNTEHLLSLVDEKTSLVSVIHVNNETGAVNDIAAISKAVKSKINSRHSIPTECRRLGKYRLGSRKILIFYAISAHKIGGIKGCGALIKRKTL